MANTAIQFLRRGRIISCVPRSPTQTVLDYLRLEEKSKGTKEGCNEGDCGACTIALGTLRDGHLRYEPVNACILLMGHLHGKELVTVDDLAVDGTLHPVQRAMVDQHASQCGFCTPGFVMSLFTLYHSGKQPTRQDIVDHIAGNLCRCTGYRPIIDAAIASCTGQAVDQWAANENESIRLLHTIPPGDVMIECGGGFLSLPAQVETLTALASVHPDATLVAGATDVGLWVTKQMRVLPKVIHIGHVKELHRIEDRPTHVSLGAAVTYAEAESHLGAIDPDIAETMRRLGSAHVRASGTIGGNIANGSPIGDTPPLLIALGANLTLRHGQEERTLPLEDFYIEYGKQDRKPGELVWRIDIPKPAHGAHFRASKLSKRFDQDISAVMAAFKVTVDNRRITAARIAFGGMAATPKRAGAAEEALRGAHLDDEGSWQLAFAALDQDFQPISDMRASAAYRMEAAKGLLFRTLTEIAGDTATRVIPRTPEAA
jgi:xanthine dehydrogenase small subunit